MKKKYIFPIIVIVAIVTLGIGLMMAPRPFDANGRYDTSHLDDMDVIYENLSDNFAFREGYSASASCPWGFRHVGLDFFLINNSKVLAATPGLVYHIEVQDNGPGANIMYYVRLYIQFNATIRIHYSFEIGTTSIDDINHQLRLFKVQEGDWVTRGQEIARFLNINGSIDHIDFGVLRGSSDRVCPQPYYSAQGYTNIMQLVHAYHPSWDLCYV
nr:hypothetical protein [Candidatus Sigynarchaeota archaeon]